MKVILDVEIVVSVICIAVFTYAYTLMESPSITTSFSCINCITGFWVCLFLAVCIRNSRKIGPEGRWMAMHIITLFLLFSVEFLRRFDILDSGLLFVFSMSAFAVVLNCIFSFWIFIREQAGKSTRASMIHPVVCALTASDLVLIVAGVVLGLTQYHADSSLIPGHLVLILWIIPVILPLLMVYVIGDLHIGCNQRMAMYSYCLIPLGFSLLSVFGSSLSFTEFAFIMNIMIIFGTFFYKRGETIIQQKADLSLSKVNPHFLFNALGSIINIDGNPPETRDALMDFSNFLRANIDLIGSDKPIPVAKEIEIVESFVNLYKIRFKSRFDVEYDIRTKCFFLPALSVEILVENAIKHGILPMKGYGLVRITVDAVDSGYSVVVEDNGVGFDTSAPNPDTSREHVGLVNLAERLNSISGGKLEIVSAPGEGTVSKIFIPIERKR